MSIGFKRIDELKWESTWCWTKTKTAEKFARMLKKQTHFGRAEIKYNIHKELTTLIVTFIDNADEAAFILKECL